LSLFHALFLLKLMDMGFIYCKNCINKTSNEHRVTFKRGKWIHVSFGESAKLRCRLCGCENPEPKR
jgi:hypothetical protein